MMQIPTPLNNEERFFYAIVERLDAVLKALENNTPEPVKVEVVHAPVQAPEEKKAPAPKRKKQAKKE